MILVGGVIIVATPALAHAPVVGNNRPGVHDIGSIAALKGYYAPEATILVEADSIRKVVHYVVSSSEYVAEEEMAELDQPEGCNDNLPASFD